MGFIIMDRLMDLPNISEGDLITDIVQWEDRDPLEIIEWLAALHREGFVAIGENRRYNLTVEGVIDIVEMRSHRDAWYREHPDGTWD